MTTHPTPVVPPLEVAKQLDAWGFNVLPAATRTKSPIVKWKQFQDQRTTGKLSAWFGGARTYNYWTTTGSVIERICLDCDNEYTERYWREVIGPEIFDATTRVKTRKGHHYWFTIPAGLIVSSASVHPDNGAEESLSYDLRAERTGIVLPPSVHESGFVYEWEISPEYMLDAPATLLALKGSGEHGQTELNVGTGGVVRSRLNDLLAEPPQGENSGRNIWLAKVAGHYAKHFPYEDAYRRLVHQAAAMCVPSLDDDEINKVASSAWNLPKTRVATDSSLTVTCLADIVPKPVQWVWGQPPDKRGGRLPLGGVSLVGGREGVGKSTLVFDLASALTRGKLPGVFFGQPKGVVIVATEDSFEHTIVPRLMADDADRLRIFRVESADFDPVTLPEDLDGLEQVCEERDVGLVILDPLMSRLSAGLDTHKDSSVRQALEPLAAFAERAGVAAVGLIHVNKTATTDPLTALMGSRAFAAVARSVLFAMDDPDEEGAHLFGHEKCNLGPKQPTLSYRIAEAVVAEDAEGTVVASKIEWCGETDKTVRDALEAASVPKSPKRLPAAEWLEAFLDKNGEARSSEVKRQGERAGHSASTLKRALKAIGGTATRQGVGQESIWTLPEPEPELEL